MNNYNTPDIATHEVDLGLRAFMLGTYKYMMAAMAVTAGVAWFIGSRAVVDGALAPWAQALYSGPSSLIYIVVIMGGFWFVGSKLSSMSVVAARSFLFGFSAVIGAMLSSITLVYDPMVITRVFFMATALFATLSLFGYSTKKDLGGLMQICVAVFFVFVLMNVLGIFFKPFALSGGTGFIFNLVGLFAIAGITAWETQKLKSFYYGTVGNAAMAEKTAIYGAANLLLSFINIFIILLRMFGSRD